MEITTSILMDSNDLNSHTMAATLRYEWIEHLMPRNMGLVRPDRVLVVGTVEDYMTVEQKVLKSSSLRGAMTQLLGWFTRRIVVHPLKEPE
jgi:hypothetical protein